jgi:hypothetical protein
LPVLEKVTGLAGQEYKNEGKKMHLFFRDMLKFLYKTDSEYKYNNGPKRKGRHVPHMTKPGLGRYLFLTIRNLSARLSDKDRKKAPSSTLLITFPLSLKNKKTLVKSSWKIRMTENISTRLNNMGRLFKVIKLAIDCSQLVVIAGIRNRLFCVNFMAPM